MPGSKASLCLLNCKVLAKKATYWVYATGLVTLVKSVPQGITAVHELLPQPERRVSHQLFPGRNVLGGAMRLAKAPCRSELLWRCLGVWAALALLSQALSRAGASLVRGGICVLCGAWDSEQAFTRLFSRWRRERRWCGKDEKLCRAGNWLLASRISNQAASPAFRQVLCC